MLQKKLSRLRESGAKRRLSQIYTTQLFRASSIKTATCRTLTVLGDHLQPAGIIKHAFPFLNYCPVNLLQATQINRILAEADSSLREIGHASKCTDTPLQSNLMRPFARCCCKLVRAAQEPVEINELLKKHHQVAKGLRGNKNAASESCSQCAKPDSCLIMDNPLKSGGLTVIVGRQNLLRFNRHVRINSQQSEL